MKTCGDSCVSAGREGVPGAYAFFARYVLMPWQSCLDVGGGMGIGLSILRRRSPCVKAIDMDARLLTFGVEVGRVEDEPTGGYDWVLAVDVIEHVENDKEFLGELFRVARKGVYLSTPNIEHHPDRLWHYHVREYSPVAFRQMVKTTCPLGRIYHFGGSTYGGDMSQQNLGTDWEHQMLVCFKRGGLVTGGLFYVREWLLKRFRKHKQS